MKRLKGFTLVELVITIAIVIILSVISVPIYRGYVDKAKWAEAYALMGVILSAQKSYYSEYGIFLDDNFALGGWVFSSYYPILEIDARGNKYFTSFDPCPLGDTDFDRKNNLNAYIFIPETLRHGNNTYLQLRYNVTDGKGAQYKERPDLSTSF